HTVQRALLRAVAGAAGLAAVLALLPGLAVARRITRPVAKLIAVTRAMGRGDRTARVGQIPAPGELRELATAFDQMANTLDRQEQLRRGGGAGRGPPPGPPRRGVSGRPRGAVSAGG